MIKLYSGHTLIQDEEGRSRTLDFDKLRDELVEAFSNCGNREVWVAENIIAVLEECIADRAKTKQAPLVRSEVERMVFTILCNAGLRDVATMFCTDEEEIEPERDWDETRLGELLRATPCISPCQAEKILPDLTAALERLNFPKVGDELIRQLALQLLPAEETKKPAASIRLFANETWQTVPNVDASLLREQVLWVRPISATIPRVAVELDLLRFADHCGDGLLLEMQVLSVMLPVARNLRRLLCAIRRRLLETAPQAGAHPVHIVLRNLDTFVKKRLPPLCPRKARNFADELRAIVDTETVRQVAFPIHLSLR